jgi:HEPN domain-containing protein
VKEASEFIPGVERLGLREAIMKTGGKKVDLQLLRNNASAFKKSAERSLEQRQFSNGQIEFFIVPAVVNLAFSIELYLKFLLAKNKTLRWGHNLLDLFNSLDSKIQQEIIDLTDYDKDEFESLLSKHTEAFHDWRYIHEKINKRKDVDLKFMKKLIDCVESIVDQS